MLKKCFKAFWIIAAIILVVELLLLGIFGLIEQIVLLFKVDNIDFLNMAILKLGEIDKF